MQDFPSVDPVNAARWLLVPGDWRRPAISAEYEILWDTERAYGQIWPRPKPEVVSTFYDVAEYYTHSSTAMLAAQSRNLSQRMQTKISWWADDGVDPDQNWWAGILGPRSLKILEIGCGNGKNLQIFTALGHRVVGIEPDPAACAVARAAGFTVYAGTAESLPAAVSADRFDAVVFMHVLEHCIDPFEAVGNAVGVLQEDGLIVAEVPNNECLAAEHFGIVWYWLDVPRHLNFFTERSLSALFEAAGLRVADVAFRGFGRHFSPAWKTAQHTIAARLGLKHPRETGYWRYLMATLRADRSRKYDSVRIVGRRGDPTPASSPSPQRPRRG